MMPLSASARQVKHPLRRAVCLGTAMIAAWGLPLHAVHAADNSKAPPPQADAVNSLRSILKDAVEQGLLDTDNSQTPDTEPAKRISPRASTPKPQAKANPAIDCKTAQTAIITDFADVTKFDDVIAAKMNLGSGGISASAPEDMRAVILSYLALGLGTEALELSERTGEDLLAVLSRILEGDVSAAELDAIKPYSACHVSFRVWSLAAVLSGPSLAASAAVITDNDYAALAAFPEKLQNHFGLAFAIHAARTGDLLSAKRFLIKHAPNTKYGGIPERKDEDLLFLYALVLQSKNDDRFAEILAHIAAGTGLFKTQALTALADDAAQSGRALPAEFESDLTAINYQYGDGLEAQTAAFELVKFRLGQNQYQDAINTAKVQFGEQEAMRLDSVSLIGDKLLVEFASKLNDRRLYALNGYFHDPAFFDSYPDAFGLTLKAHDTAAALDLPELAHQLLPRLERFNAESQHADIKKSVKLAEAQLAYKASDYADAVMMLKGIKGEARFDALRKDAALASGDRALAQSVLASLPPSPKRDTDYLAFTLQKGLWTESKLQAQTILAKEKLASKKSAAASVRSDAPSITEAPLPFAFSVELLDYLTTPASAAEAAANIPDNSAELEALLLTLKSNTNVAKGFLNYDSSSP